MTTLAWLMLRAAGWPRHLLVVASTSFTAGMLLVVVALLRLPQQPDEDLFDLIAMPATRAGAALAGARPRSLRSSCCTRPYGWAPPVVIAASLG